MEIMIHRPTTRTRRLLVSALVATLLLTVTPPVTKVLTRETLTSTWKRGEPGSTSVGREISISRGRAIGLGIYGLSAETIPRLIPTSRS